MTPQSKERPVKVRKPGTILRYLANFQHYMSWNFEKRDFRALLSELRRSLAQQPPQGRSAGRKRP